MTFQATVREIDNGFLVQTTLPGEHYYHESYDKTLMEALATVLLVHDKWSTPATPPKAPEEPLKKPSEAAVKYTKVAGLLRKQYVDYLTQFLANFPGENAQEALVAANCKLVDGQVVFVGG
jgi:hypothetical protein